MSLREEILYYIAEHCYDSDGFADILVSDVDAIIAMVQRQEYEKYKAHAKAEFVEGYEEGKRETIEQCLAAVAQTAVMRHAGISWIDGEKVIAAIKEVSDEP